MPTSTYFTLQAEYSRAEIREIMGDPGHGGAWDTGYREFQGEFFVFCGVGAAGRTGHNYNNHWDGEYLAWEAKEGTTFEQPQIQKLLNGRHPVHIFSREQEQAPFRYQGLGRPVTSSSTTPVRVLWAFDVNFRPTMTRKMVSEELEKLGFDVEAAKVKSQRASLNDIVVYVKQESDSLVLVIDPRFEDRLDELRAIPGVRRNAPAGHYVHNQSFRSFPTRIHKGTDARPYGLDFDFDNPESLAAFVEALLQPAIVTPITTQSAPEMIDPRTETESIRAARLGQTRFRNALMDRWSRRCALTSLPLPELLRASHIKPWCDSTPTERLDPHNGLLLAVHVDALFDRGIITFADDGRLLVSSVLNRAVQEQLGLKNLKIRGLSEENHHYLDLHRKKYFKGE